MVNSHRRVDIYGYDASGSVSQLLTATGAVSATYGYTVYSDEDPQLSRGDTLKDSGTGAKNHSPTNPIRYSAKRWDTGSGTLDMGARRFGPSTSRFLQQDRYGSALIRNLLFQAAAGQIGKPKMVDARGRACYISCSRSLRRDAVAGDPFVCLSSIGSLGELVSESRIRKHVSTGAFVCHRSGSSTRRVARSGLFRRSKPCRWPRSVAWIWWK
jgi:RHS repeat-associated protein